MFGSIGMPELIVIMVVALIVIGPKRLPDLAKSLGRALRDFKRATSEFQDNLSLDDDVADSIVTDEENSISEAAKEEKTPQSPGHTIDPGADRPDSSAPSGSTSSSAGPDDTSEPPRERAETP